MNLSAVYESLIHITFCYHSLWWLIENIICNCEDVITRIALLVSFIHYWERNWLTARIICFDDLICSTSYHHLARLFFFSLRDDIVSVRFVTPTTFLWTPGTVFKPIKGVQKRWRGVKLQPFTIMPLYLRLILGWGVDSFSKESTFQNET